MTAKQLPSSFFPGRNNVRLPALLALFLALTSPLPAQQNEPLTLPIDLDRAAEAWEFEARQLKVVADDVTGEPSFESAATVDSQRPGPTIILTSKAELPVPVVIEARVRLPAEVSKLVAGRLSRASAQLGWVQPSPGGGAPTIDSLEISRGRARDNVSCLAGVVRNGERGIGRTFSPLHKLEDISPLMDENVRLVLERRADRLPIAHQRVHDLRVEVRRDSMRMYWNGRFVQEIPGDYKTGRVRVVLSNQVRLLGAGARALAEGPDRFLVVPLTDFFNAKGPSQPPGLAPQPGRVATVEGVPFITSTGPQGEDNLDLAPSVFLHRMGDMRIGDSRESVHPPERMDVTRFTMHVPQRTWRRAWVLAASDDDPNSAPVLTVRFYIPKTPWTVDGTTEVPSYSATSSAGNAKRIAWEKAGDKIKSLWLIPIELDAAALAVQPMGALELTKAIHPYRGYPDPAYYNSYPGGLPSAVHVYALTLEEAPVWARGTGTKNGNFYVDGETPTWRVLLKNLSDKKLEVDVAVKVTDPYGKSTQHAKRVPLDGDDKQHEIAFQPPAEVFGLYTVRTTVRAGDFTQTREGTFLKLPPNHARATATNSPWGLWCWNGGHNTNPDPADNMRLLRALGAINNFPINERVRGREEKEAAGLVELRRKNGIGAMHYRLVSREMPEWSTKDPYDPAAYAAFAEEKGKEAKAALEANPDLQFVNVFAENYISLRLTHGMSPWAMGQPWFTYDEKEGPRLRAHWLTAKAAVEGVRKHAPTLKFLFGHGAGNFVQPFLKLDDWKNDLFDGFGMDLPQFERMPERQPRATEPSLLFFQHHEMKKMGLTHMEVVHLESYFPSSGPLALTFDEQADSVVRTAVLSLSLGTTKFMRTWELHTSGDGWGGSHYGSAGLIDRAPEFNPKPAAAAFATMTRVLDLAKYDGYLDTGSRSAFCVRFKDSDRLVYAVWTIRGTRPLTLTFDGTPTVECTDMHGNTNPLKLDERKATVTLSSSPQWIVVRGGSLSAASVGTPAYTEAPRAVHRVLDPLDGGWSYDAGPFPRYQNNHWDMPREPGAMKQEFVNNEQRKSNVMRVELTNPDSKKPMVGFYGLFKPSKPIELAGKPRALGLWVNGHSAWNRFIYEVVDAKGEVWLSCGTKDAWNCDDIFSWSSINHDGWRYMSFPLPSTAPGDNYREADTTWWGSDGDGIVDLPLRLNRIIIEMRPQMIYVNDMLPIPDLSIELDDLTVEYESEADQTDAPVKVQMAARDVLNEGKLLPLPNPFAALQKTGIGDAPKIVKVYPPEQINNGRRLFVEVEPVTGATRYRGYVSAYADGRGAKPLAIDQQTKHNHARLLKDHPTTLYFDGLQPSRPMYLFVTSLDKDGHESKPSAIREVVLKDEFPFQ